MENTMSKSFKILLPTLLITLLTACDQTNEQSQQTITAAEPETSSTAMPSNHPPMTTQGTNADFGILQGGVITETFNSGGYTYVHVERNGQKTWAAGPETQLEQGSLVAWREGAVMKSYTSPSLNRTFDQIHFVNQFLDPSQHQSAMQRPSANTQAGIGGIIKEVLSGGGYTYVKVAINGVDVWAAGPLSQLKVDETVTWSSDAQKMTNFNSPTLNKTFNEIYFVAGFNPNIVTGQGQPNQAPTHGAVEEVISSAGYSYLKVNLNNKQVWLAAPETEVKQQDKITWVGGAVMYNFESPTLNRTFDEIVFVDRINILN
jgi:starvation-inducible outer membrane lipoprotein